MSWLKIKAINVKLGNFYARYYQGNQPKVLDCFLRYR